MAKEKIRKLLRERQALNNRINSLAGMLALLTNREGGEVTFTQAELSSIPSASFRIDITDGLYTLTLTYDEKAMERHGLTKHLAEADKIEAELGTTTQTAAANPVPQNIEEAVA